MPKINAPDNNLPMIKNTKYYQVDVIIWKVTIPKGKSYNEACETDMLDEFNHSFYTSYTEARKIADKLKIINPL